jgi:outer membrane protein W
MYLNSGKLRILFLLIGLISLRAEAQFTKSTLFFRGQIGGYYSDKVNENISTFNSSIKQQDMFPTFSFHYLLNNKISVGAGSGYIYKEYMNDYSSFSYNYTNKDLTKGIPVQIYINRYFRMNNALNIYTGIVTGMSKSYKYSWQFEKEREISYRKYIENRFSFGLQFGIMYQISSKFFLNLELSGFEYSLIKMRSEDKKNSSETKELNTLLSKGMLSIGFNYKLNNKT